jgi:peroxiredoxin
MKRLMLPLGLFFAFCMISATKLSTGLKVGDTAPTFTLKNINDKMVSLADYKTDGVIVIFSCNHCPYAKAYEERIVALNTKYSASYPVVMINPNDAASYPDDNFANMKIRAKDKNFNFPYLVDESQEIAKTYGALKTPHIYLLKKENDKHVVKYIGAIDDNTYDASKVKTHYLEEAIENLQKGEVVKLAETKAIGCGIKWK